MATLKGPGSKVAVARYPSIGTKIPNGWQVVERYPLYSPFSYAAIAEDAASSTKIYFLDEVGLSPQEAGVYTYVLNTLESELTVPRKDVNPTVYFEQQAGRIAKKYSIKVPELAWTKILYFAERDIVGFGALDGIMRDPNIEDISVDGTARPVFVYHRKYERLATNVSFSTEDQVDDLISRFAHMSGKHISTAFPIMQGSLPGGHRMMATFRREVSPKGGTMSIRKFRQDPITIIDMLNYGVLDHTLAAYVWLLMENRATAIVVGATGGGKTTLLNSLLTLTRTNTKIITIEEVQEINLAHPNWTALVSRESYGVTEEGPKEVGLFALVKAAMRMRPDVLVVGEVRGEEAYVLLQAISTGHGGLCTLHADDAASAVQRLISKPMDVPPSFIPFIDLAFTVRRITFPDPTGGLKSGRRIISVDEIMGVEDYIRMFTWDHLNDKQVASPFKKSKKLAKIASDLGITMADVEAEIRRRAVVLRWIQQKGVRNFKELTPLFEAYVTSSNEIFERAERELNSPIVEEKKEVPEIREEIGR